MPTITIRNLPTEVVARLKICARLQGHSMEQEARDILTRRLASREAVLDEVQARWDQLSPPSAQEVQGWIQAARLGEK